MPVPVAMILMVKILCPTPRFKVVRGIFSIRDFSLPPMPAILSGGWYLTSSPVSSANWEAKSSDRWTIPVGGGAGRLVRFGDQPVDFKLQAFGYAEKPGGGPDWNLQFSMKFLFPK